MYANDYIKEVGIPTVVYHSFVTGKDSGKNHYGTPSYGPFGGYQTLCGVRATKEVEGKGADCQRCLAVAEKRGREMFGGKRKG